MNFGKTMSWRRAATVAAGLVLAVTMTAEPALGRDGTHRPGAPGRQTSPFNLHSHSPTFLLNFNEWLCGLDNGGEVCSSSVGSSVGGGGFWPSGTANQYIFNSGLQVAAVIGPQGGTWAGDTVASYFFEARGGGPGVGLTNIFASTRPDDLANWPQECFLDNPVFGRVAALSQLDTCVQYWDGDPTAKHFSDSHPMGLQVTQHSLQWSFPNNKDILFFIYKFTNVSNRADFRSLNPQVPAGGYDLTNVYAAFGMDPDVGSEYRENFASVVPDLDMAVAWASDFEDDNFVPYAPNFDAAPGFVGVKYLKSPVNTSDTTVTVRVGTETTLVAPGEELGLTYFSVNTNGGIMSDPRTAKQAFRYLSGELLPEEEAAWCPDSPPGMCYVNIQKADDMRFYQSSGPFTLKPGQSAEIVVAYVAGAPVPGTYTKGTVIPVGSPIDETRRIEKVMGRGFTNTSFPSLFQNAATAQAIFDINFVLPASPPPPTVSAIPGNKEIVVTWSDTPVNEADPFFAIASRQFNEDGELNPLFNPNFRENDFEGFRVYRTSNPAAGYELIAQFDRANGIGNSEGNVVTVLEEVTTASGDVLVIRADTARTCPVDASGCVVDTGLKFSIVDRGGAFPNPQNGPGLINGLRYHYAVTAFDINSPLSGPSTIESARVLTNEARSVGAASAVPRGTAAGITAAQFSAPEIIGGDKVLNPNAPVPTIDPAKGTFSGPQPPTNAINPQFVAIDPQLLIAGTLSMTIDSVIPLVGYTSSGQSYEAMVGRAPQTAGNCLGASTRYFLTVRSGNVTRQTTKEISTPFTLFGCPTRAEAELFNESFTGSAARATELGRDPNQFASAFTAEIAYERTFLLSGAEAVSAFRTHDVHEENGSRWFVGNEAVAEPTLGTKHGELPGVKEIFGLPSQYEYQRINLGGSPATSVRWQLYLLNSVMRAADIQVTWGANGEITKVFDVTHNVEVPFEDSYKASWGVMQDASGDGVVSFGDNWLVTPIAEWYCEEPGCHTPMTRTAKIGPISTIPPRRFGVNVSAANAQGFMLYIAGEHYMFVADQLPAAGTVWTLRTYAGDITKSDAGVYSFAAADTRPPTVPGLSFRVNIESAAAFDASTVTLDNVRTVPDPYYITNLLETGPSAKQLLFTGLPPEATVRIYTLSGVLVKALQHNDPTGGGQMSWDLRSRNNQFLASGVYFYHVETPAGKEKVGKFTIIQFAQ